MEWSTGLKIELDFPDLIKRDDLCERIAEGIFRDNGFPFRGSRILEGSTVLYRSNGLVVKVFSPEEPEFCSNEAQFLSILHGKLGVSTPDLIAHGTYMGYPYIIMEEIQGFPLKALWANMTRRDREKITEQAAVMLRELHSIPVKKVTQHETVWGEFAAEQMKNLEANHRGFGLNENRIEEILHYMESTGLAEISGPKVICHTEIMREHLFLQRIRGEVTLTGLIDFEPSMVAVPGYDLCSVGLFLTAGEKGLFQRFRNTYGYREEAANLMRMLLLHRYSNMKWFISTVPLEMQAKPLECLADYWYS